MIEMSNKKLKTSIKELPELINENGIWKLSENLENDKVYWTAFGGTDSDAEDYRTPDRLTFLGESLDEFDSDVQCCISGKNTNVKFILQKHINFY